MFRNDEQRSAVARALLRSLRLQHLWDERPTDEAIDLLDHNGGYLSSGERIIMMVAWDVWNGDGKANLGEVMYNLDAPRTRLVGTLLIAMSDGGSNAIDGWLQEHGRGES